jgi:large subunit ribosomal protein L17
MNSRLQICLIVIVALFVPLCSFVTSLKKHCPSLSPLSEKHIRNREFRGSALFISHQMGFNPLNRPADQRKALLRAITTELIRHGRIRTTITKAKAVRKPVDHMITLAKRGTLHARRQALSYIYDKNLVHALFQEARERYQNRSGGYCRIIPELRPRRGDGAQMATIELV